MQLIYEGKKNKEDILNKEYPYSFSRPWNKENNLLIQGDNLISLQLLLKRYDLRGKIDFIYIDPPFATNNVFVIGEERTRTISGSNADKIAYKDTLLGEEFIEFLRERLILAYELLSEKGSIYVHLDYKIGHYIKIAMDEIFGIENFRNDIARIKCNPKNFAKTSYGNIKDLILFYTKTKNNIWNDINTPFSEEDIKRLYKKMDSTGRMYTTIPLHAPGETKNGTTGEAFNGIKPPIGRHWRCSPSVLEKLDEEGMIEWSNNGVPRRIIYADEQKGKKVQDIWEYKDSQYPAYPTEKNLKLLEYMIENSSNRDSIVLDFFCGSGTTLLAANNLQRQWIGIDSSEHAIKITRERLSNNIPELFPRANYDLIFLKAITDVGIDSWIFAP